MQCERLMKLAKSWYTHVREETMAPARMISFMEKHAAECPVCQADPDLPGEIAKITEMILPESKIPKAMRNSDDPDDADPDDDDIDDDDDDRDDMDDDDEDNMDDDDMDDDDYI
jgi:hypothetical protein